MTTSKTTYKYPDGSFKKLHKDHIDVVSGLAIGVRTGTTQSQETKDKISKSCKKDTHAVRETCPHCNLRSSSQKFKAEHFDNCYYKPVENSEDLEILIKEILPKLEAYNIESDKAIIKDAELVNMLLKTGLIQHFEGTRPTRARLIAGILLAGLRELPKCVECDNEIIEFGMKNNPEINPRTKFGNFKDFCSISCMTKSELTLEKRKKTSIEKYGVDHCSKNKEFQAEQIKKNIEKNGGLHFFQTKHGKEKITEGMYKKFGVSHSSKSVLVLQKRTNNYIKKHGVSTHMQNKVVLYGIYRNNIARIFCNSVYCNDILEVIDSNTNIMECYDGLCKIIQTIKDSGATTLYDFCQAFCVTYSQLLGFIRRFKLQKEFNHIKGRSLFEADVINYIESLGESFEVGRRDLLKSGLEIDITIPSKNICIECNGTYWHSEIGGKKPKEYHLNKTIEVNSMGYKLFHIFEWEWNEPIKQNIWKSILRNALGKNGIKLYARNCIIKDITYKDAKEFLNNNHIQGIGSGASHYYGLFHEDVLVSCLTIGASRFSKEYEYEILRVATKINVTVVGGVSKLLKQFIREIQPNSIVCFQERRISGIPSVAYNDIFLECSETPIGWWAHWKHKIYHRLFVQHETLENHIENYDKNISALDNFRNNGGDRIWDCGQWKFVYRNR